MKIEMFDLIIRGHPCIWFWLVLVGGVTKEREKERKKAREKERERRREKRERKEKEREKERLTTKHAM